MTLSVLVLAGCGWPFSTGATDVLPSPTPMPGLGTQTPIPPSPTPQVLLDTPTLAPSPSETPPVILETPTIALPTATLSSLATSPAIPSGNIALTPGTTAGVVQGSIGPGQVQAYTLGAAQSQPLTLLLDSTNDDVTLGVFGPGGEKLLDPASKVALWQMVLPSTGLYTIQVIGGATSEDYLLTFKLPLRVNFAPGATSVTLNGTTVRGYLFSYAVACSGGQTMTASLNVPATTAALDIYGMTTGTLLDISANVNTWTGLLPRTQDYVIEVVPAGGQVVNYALTVSCTGSSSGTYGGGEIAFTTGETAAVKLGTISPGQVVTYTVQADRAQPMILDVESPNWDVTLGVVAPDGGRLFDESVKWTHYQIQTPYTGTYTIKVFGGATTEEYILTVKVGQLVYFPNDYQTSIVLYGQTNLGYVHTYGFRCSAGQEMTVSLNVDSTRAYLAVFGINGEVLLDFHDMATTWTGTLPTTQEYVVEVIPRGGYLVTYILTVTIP